MTDATLLGRLSGVSAPTLVVWGEANRIGDSELGRACADAIPGAQGPQWQRYCRTLPPAGGQVGRTQEDGGCLPRPTMTQPSGSLEVVAFAAIVADDAFRVKEVLW